MVGVFGDMLDEINDGAGNTFGPGEKIGGAFEDKPVNNQKNRTDQQKNDGDNSYNMLFHSAVLYCPAIVIANQRGLPLTLLEANTAKDQQ